VYKTSRPTVKWETAAADGIQRVVIGKQGRVPSQSDGMIPVRLERPQINGGRPRPPVGVYFLSQESAEWFVKHIRPME